MSELPRFVMCICTGQCPGFESLDLWDLIIEPEIVLGPSAGS